MKFRIICCFLILSLFSCILPFDDDDEDKEAYRDGQGSEVLINEGSLVGSWEETHEWRSFRGDYLYWKWDPININYSDNYMFLEDGTFTSTNIIDDCKGTNGTYTIEGSKIILKYICEIDPEVTKDILIDEFFFREKHIVFIKGNDTSNISKFELVKEN